jgi:hypothetical protein
MDTVKVTEPIFGLIDHLAESLEGVEDIEVGTVALVVEVNGTVPESWRGKIDDDKIGEQFTWVLYRCSDARRWVQHGLFAAATRAVALDD